MYVLTLADGVTAAGQTAETGVPGGAESGLSQHPTALFYVDLTGTMPSATVVIQGRVTSGVGGWVDLATVSFVMASGADAVEIPLLPFMRVDVQSISGAGASLDASVVIYEER